MASNGNGNDETLFECQDLTAWNNNPILMQGC